MTNYEKHKRELMKDWRFRFWYGLLAPQYWLMRLVIKLQIRRRERAGEYRAIEEELEEE